MALTKKSEYFAQLSAEAKIRYESNLTSAGLDIDPYCIEESLWTREPEVIPKVMWTDISFYMVSAPSPYTKEAVKAWKGMLDADGFVQSGWVHDLLLHQFTSDKFVVKGKVKHSQRLSSTPLVPWSILMMDGDILAAHCTCMAGLGKACSHIAAMLSCVVKASELMRSSGKESCTSKKCVWLPSAKDVTPAFVRDIDFSKEKCTSDTPSMNKRVSSTVIHAPNEEKLQTFLNKINGAKAKPAILKITQPFASQFIPKSSTSVLPVLLSEYYNSETLHKDYLSLLDMCESVYPMIQVSADQIVELEKTTRDQASSSTWFAYRAGRITASNMKAAARTNPAMPSPSLIKRLCYPELYKFSTKATRWGCSHEEIAVDAYKSKAGKDHEDHHVTQAGLFLHPDTPFIGASPDGMVSCKCCGEGVLEVKCPFHIREGLPEDDDPGNFCMTKIDGEWSLKRDHSYFFQVQTQLQVCRLPYANFVLWTETGIIIERIYVDPSIWEGLIGDVQHFFKYGILAEIVGKWYSRKPIADSEGIVPVIPDEPDDAEDEEDYEKLWCFCQQPSFGRMIHCDDERCTIIWFHCECLRIRSIPKGKWYCPSCRKDRRKNSKK